MRKSAAIWSGDVSLSAARRAELAALGLDERTIATIAWAASYVASYYATNPPNRKDRRDGPAAVQQKLAETTMALAELHPETVKSIEAIAYRLPPIAKLLELLGAYAEAAGRLAIIAAHAPTRGPDAVPDTHLATMVGVALQDGGVDLDDSTGGPFVSAVKAAFEALGIHKADVRNDARRALKLLIRRTG